jgi:hypothetical protein
MVRLQFIILLSEFYIFGLFQKVALDKLMSERESYCFCLTLCLPFSPASGGMERGKEEVLEMLMV